MVRHCEFAFVSRTYKSIKIVKTIVPRCMATAANGANRRPLRITLQCHSIVPYGPVMKIGKRETQRLARRAQIIAMAREHFFDHGYDGTSMSAIATALGGSKGTLWNYFP